MIIKLLAVVGGVAIILGMLVLWGMLTQADRDVSRGPRY